MRNVRGSCQSPAWVKVVGTPARPLPKFGPFMKFAPSARQFAFGAPLVSFAATFGHSTGVSVNGLNARRLPDERLVKTVVSPDTEACSLNALRSSASTKIRALPPSDGEFQLTATSVAVRSSKRKPPRLEK